MQVKASAEAIGESGEAACGVFRVSENVVSAGQGGFELAQDDVDPFEFGHVARLAIADDGLVDAAGLSDGGKAGQAVAQDGGTGLQARLGSSGHCIEGKASMRGELDELRVHVGVQGNWQRALVVSCGTQHRPLARMLANGLSVMTFLAGNPDGRGRLAPFPLAGRAGGRVAAGGPGCECCVPHEMT